MSDERVEVAPRELARWFVIAAVVIAGLGLYFWLSPGTRAVPVSQVQEAGT